MAIKPRFMNALWMLPGVAMLLLIALMVFDYYRGQDAAAQIAARTKRVELVAEMRLDLASGSVAEKSAVLAVADKESQTFADQARAGTAVVERKYRELARLVTATGTARERELLTQFDKAFGEFQRIHHELLSLAVRNTNTKAFNLAFGPAAVAVQDMEDALSQVVAKGSGAREFQKLERLACGARIGALRIQALLAPHIAERSDQQMDEFEARMAKEDQKVKRDLAALEQLSRGPDLEIAVRSYARFGELRAEILTLSRENTDVRSLAMSLDQDTKAMLTCQDALAALQNAIKEEPAAGVTYGAPARPR